MVIWKEKKYMMAFHFYVSCWNYSAASVQLTKKKICCEKWKLAKGQQL